MNKLSVVVPCYNEERDLNNFYQAVEKCLEGLDTPYELIFVNDGSTDYTASILKEFAIKNQSVKVINLSKNFGQQASLVCGFKHCTGDCVLELDVKPDLPFEIISKMIAKWEEGYSVVHTQNKKKGNAFTRFFKRIYLKFLKAISKIDIPLDTDEFKLYDKRIVDEICRLSEQDKYIMAITSWVGFKQTCITYSVKTKSKNGKNIISKAMSFASAGIIGNSTWPLCLSFWVGTVLNILCQICFTVFTTLACCKIYLPLSAWLFPTIVMLFSLLFMINSFSNIYLGKIYNQVKGRPEYIIEDTLNIN